MSDIELIEGLKVEVSGHELADWLRERVIAHRDKATEYRRQLDVLGQSNVGQFSGDPRTGLQQKVDEHARKADHFSFMADHLKTTALYRLTERDLIFVEIINDGRW